METWMNNYNFRVLINDVQYGFSRVSNLSAEMEVETVQDGGFGPLFLPKDRSKYDTLVLERGVRLLKTSSANLDVGTVVIGMVIALGSLGEMQMEHNFTFNVGVVTKVELSGLDATGHEILIEKIEIAHSGLI